MQEPKKKAESLPSSTQEPFEEPARPRTWPIQPPTQPSDLSWPIPTSLSAIDIGEIHRLLMEILSRLDSIEHRLDKIENRLSAKSISP